MSLHDFSGDYRFDIANRDVYQGRVHQACRLAVLWPLARMSGQRVSSLVLDYATLVRRWRAKVVGLASNGWSAATKLNVDPEVEKKTDWKAVTYLRNCPPFGVRNQETARVCGRGRVCPWCYARHVVYPAYNCLSWAIYDQPFATQVSLVAVRRQKVLDLAKTPFPKLLDGMSAGRGFEAGLVPLVAGSLVSVTIEPSERTEDQLLATRSTILLLPAQASFDKLSESVARGQGEIRCWTNAEGGQPLADLVGWALCYPTGMMFGDNRLTAQILNQTAEREDRMLSTTGLLRNRKAWEAANREKHERLVAAAERSDG